jgi:hypothetical protein
VAGFAGLAILSVAATASALGLRPAAVAGGPCAAPPPLTFSEPKYIDPERSGGEPTIATHPDGTLLVGTHAGTTHIYPPGAGEEGGPGVEPFAGHYDGRTYYFWSGDQGRTWTFVDRGLPPDGLPGSGFSDPDFAIDAAGNVFISEINLANISMSRSSDAGRSYVLQNALAETITDRQWSEADLADVVYLTGNSEGGGTSTQPVGELGHTLYRSTDGGLTFTPGLADPGGTGDVEIDRRNGTLYEANMNGGRLSIAAFRNARKGDLSRELNTVADGVALLGGQWPSFDVDRDGNLYLAWAEEATRETDRVPGVYYTTSQDGGRHWSTPVRVDTDDRTDIWPWVAVGDPGRVAVAWFQADIAVPNDDPQTPGTHGWRVALAQSTEGFGCAASPDARFTVSMATPRPFHTGTICTEGTTCEAMVVDRRLGDYFEISIDATGRVWGVFADTNSGGIVGIAAFVRQAGGPLFTAPPTAPPPPAPPTGRTLPTTLAG